MALVDITSENIDQYLSSENIVILDFWASWCGPCMQFLPTFEELAQKFPDITFGKVNVVESEDLVKRFKIRTVPKVCFFLGTELKDENFGLMDKEQLTTFIEKNLALISA